VMVTDGMTARESDVEVLDVAQALLRAVKPQPQSSLSSDNSQVS
jgi:hypothetical protein